MSTPQPRPGPHPQMVDHYEGVVRLIESLLLRRVPRLLRGTAQPLEDREVTRIATALANAHVLANYGLVTEPARGDARR